MEEVKKQPGILGQSKREVMDAFKCFMEDYNTATMPHEKYYNYERWEMEEYHRKQNKKASKSSKNVQEVFDDETEVMNERRRKKEMDEKREFNDTLAKMAHDKDKRASMRRQEELRAELQLAYRQGDTVTVSRLERLLAPEEEKGGAKHPWAG
jgi:hypothetical protein